MFRPALIMTLALWGTAGLALDDGEYNVETEGASGTLTITGNLGTIDVGGPGCAGGGEGNMFRSDDGSWILLLRSTNGPAATCALQGGALTDGQSPLVQGPGCSSFHGASCNLSGSVLASNMTDLAEPSSTPEESPDPVTGSFTLSAELLRAQFMERDELARTAIQNELAYLDFYDADIDGLYGRGTETAIYDAVMAQRELGVDLNLDSETRINEALDLIAMPSQVSNERLGIEMSYHGNWICEFFRFDLTEDTFRITSSDGDDVFSEGSYQSNAETPLDDFIGVTLEGPGNLSLFNITPYTMGLHDPADGVSQLCQRAS